MKDFMVRYAGGDQIKDCYVACSEACLYNVKMVLDTIHLRSRQKFQVLLGVDKLAMSEDRIEIEDETESSDN